MRSEHVLVPTDTHMNIYDYIYIYKDILVTTKHETLMIYQGHTT
jgi:hypothetical protein